MKLNAKFSINKQRFPAEFGKFNNISDGGFERGYAAGYAEGEIAGHDAGQAEGIEQGKQAEYDRLVDPAKIIEKTVTGSMVRVDDVSEIPHKCTVSVGKDATVTVFGKNLFDESAARVGGSWHKCNDSNYLYFPIEGLMPNTEYTFSFTENGYIANQPANYYLMVSNDPEIKNTNGCLISSNIEYCRLVVTVVSNSEGKLFVRSYGMGMDETALNDVFNTAKNAMLELGKIQTAYEPYNATTHTITAGQTIEVDSICPTMTLFADNDATITLGYHKSWGMQTEYDRFWDAYQQNGNKTNYDQAFGYTHWTDETYNPKYDIVCSGGTSARQMFYNGRMTSTKVPIRVKNASLNNTFAGSSIKTIVLLELVGVTSYNNPFSTCTALENITIEGSIDASFNISATAVLTDTSVQSIIDHLKDLTGATAQTLTFHATVGAKLTDAQKATITAKNWTLVY